METTLNRIYITATDLEVLSSVLGKAAASDPPHIRLLRERLAEAEVVPTDGIPAGVIGLGSEFRIRDMDTGQTMDYTLVLPKDARLERGYVSVVAPIGAQLLGAREDQIITFKTPSSSRRLKVGSVASNQFSMISA